MRGAKRRDRASTQKYQIAELIRIRMERPSVESTESQSQRIKKMIKKVKTEMRMNTLPWFKLWTGNFKSKTEHLGNTEVGAYIRLLASYWNNNGLPFNEQALSRIARIEAEDNVDLGALVGEFFEIQDGHLRHEEMDALRIEAIGEEDANRRRTFRARATLAEQRKSVTIPVADTEVDIDVDGDREGNPDREREGDPEPEEHPHPEVKFKNQTDTRTVNADPEADRHRDAERLPPCGDSGGKISVQIATSRRSQSASLNPDGVAQGGAAPAASSVQSDISFRLKDGSVSQLSEFCDRSQLSAKPVGTLKQLAERFESIPQTRVTGEELPKVMRQWLLVSGNAA